MQADLIIDGIVLAAVLEADLGRRKIGVLRVARPLLMAGAIVPLFLKAGATTGTGLVLEIALSAAGVALGLVATALISVSRSPRTGRPVSRAGVGYAALWGVVIGARAVFSYGSTHWFGHQLGDWMTRNSVTAAGLTDALIFMAIAMMLTRTAGLAIRAGRCAAVRSDDLTPGDTALDEMAPGDMAHRFEAA